MPNEEIIQTEALKPGFENVYLHRKKMVKTYVNKNGNEFAIIGIGGGQDQATTEYLTLSTKLIKGYEFSKSQDKTFDKAENPNSTFIQIAIPLNGELSVSVKNNATGEYTNDNIKAVDHIDTFRELNFQTIQWAKINKANKVKSFGIKFDETKIVKKDEDLEI